jgi:hypothetical protein
MKMFLLDYMKCPSNMCKQTFKSALHGWRNQGKGVKNGQGLALIWDYDQWHWTHWWKQGDASYEWLF